MNAWFPHLEPRDGAALRLICFPYAGGTASVYRDWQERLGSRVEVVPVLPPGRGLRSREQPYSQIGPLVTDLVDAIVKAGLAGSDYAMFGHSMGALVAYEAACELRDRGETEPSHLFVSASRAPHLYGGETDSLLPDDALLDLVRGLGGLVGDESVAGAYFERRLPVLRADLGVCETYRWTPRRPLNCPMTAYSADGDPIAPPLQVEAWRSYTYGSLLLRHIPGGHFYLNGPASTRLLDDLDEELRSTQLRTTEGTRTERRIPAWTH